MSPILGIWASQNYSRYSLPTSFDSIATSTVGAGGASFIEFTSIPQTYTHLQLRALVKTARSVAANDSLFVRVNGSSTASHYASHTLYGNGTTAAASSMTNDGRGMFLSEGAAGSGGNATSSMFGVFIMDVLDYTNTSKATTFRTLNGVDVNGSGGQMDFTSGLYTPTTAVTSIRFTPDASTFVQYSTIALYGIKGD